MEGGHQQQMVVGDLKILMDAPCRFCYTCCDISTSRGSISIGHLVEVGVCFLGWMQYCSLLHFVDSFTVTLYVSTSVEISAFATSNW